MCKEEENVWNLLVQNGSFNQIDAAEFGVKISNAISEKEARLQLFEFIFTAILAQLEKDFEWTVSRVSKDEGIDFKGEKFFLNSKELKLKGSITIGGQCKKRGGTKGPKENWKEIRAAGLDLVESLSPTFIVIAYSANIEHEAVIDIGAKFKDYQHLDAHVLNRESIEALFRSYFPIVEKIIEKSELSQNNKKAVLDYFYKGNEGHVELVEISVPEKIISGVPFDIQITLEHIKNKSLLLNANWHRNPQNKAIHLLSSITPIGNTEAPFKAKKSDLFRYRLTLGCSGQVIPYISIGE